MCELKTTAPSAIFWLASSLNRPTTAVCYYRDDYPASKRNPFPFSMAAMPELGCCNDPSAKRVYNFFWVWWKTQLVFHQKVKKSKDPLPNSSQVKRAFKQGLRARGLQPNPPSVLPASDMGRLFEPRLWVPSSWTLKAKRGDLESPLLENGVFSQNNRAIHPVLKAHGDSRYKFEAIPGFLWVQVPMPKGNGKNMNRPQTAPSTIF